MRPVKAVSFPLFKDEPVSHGRTCDDPRRAECVAWFGIEQIFHRNRFDRERFEVGGNSRRLGRRRQFRFDVSGEPSLYRQARGVLDEKELAIIRRRTKWEGR